MDKILSHQNIIKCLKQELRENGRYSLIYFFDLVCFTEFIFSSNPSGLMVYLSFKFIFFFNKGIS